MRGTRRAGAVVRFGLRAGTQCRSSFLPFPSNPSDPMLLDASQSQLVLVDYQSRLMPAIFEGDAAAANAVRLAKIAALVDVPVWGTEQNPSKLG